MARQGLNGSALTPLAHKVRRPLKVAVLVPSGDQWQGDTAFDIAQMLMFTARNSDLEIALHNMRLSNLLNLRNQMVQRALADGADAMLFIDSDMRFPSETLLRLLSHGRDIVAANCVQRAFPTRATAWKNGSHLYTEAHSTGLEEVEMVGTAVMLIRTSVFHKLNPPAFFFPPRPDDPINTLGEDQFFCQKAREAGFKIWVDHDLSKHVGHIGTVVFTHEMAVACRDGVPVDLRTLSGGRTVTTVAPTRTVNDEHLDLLRAADSGKPLGGWPSVGRPDQGVHRPGGSRDEPGAVRPEPGAPGAVDDVVGRAASEPAV